MRMRLDKLLVERGLVTSREQAQRLILAAAVRVDGAPAAKPSDQVADTSEVSLVAAERFVSRGGHKLEAGLAAWNVDCREAVAVDIGASTGGFTDCLLQHGAALVYAIDVGYGQLAWSLRQDPRVISIERANVRTLQPLPEPVRLATIDVSFIGLGLVFPRVVTLLEPAGEVVALIKPQFEAGKGQVGKGGVVREPQVHRAVIERVLDRAAAEGLSPAGLIRSPITGPAGNVEFLAWLRLRAEDSATSERARWLDNLGLPRVES